MKKLLVFIGIFSVISLSACSGEKQTAVEGENVLQEQVSPVNEEQEVERNNEGLQEEESPVTAPQENLQEEYEIVTELYSDENVRVEYPQITNFGNEEKETVINELIKKEALAPFLNVMKNIEANQDYEADATYEIKLKNDKVLSIAYTSYNNITTAAHPFNMFHTININLNTGKKLVLLDFIYEVDDAFLSLLKKSKYVGEIGEEYEEQIREQAFGWYENDGALIEALTKDNSDHIPFYVTGEAIGFSMPVAHAAGDHAEFEISLSELKDKIIFEWN